MDNKTVRDETRQRIAIRASGRCEYCLYPEQETLITHQLDHIIAKQHGGTDDDDNLAFCCAICNRFKGPNLTSIDPETHAVTKLFNPRKQHWQEHFKFDDVYISGLTPEGRATVFLLRFNDETRLAERQILQARGRFPYHQH